MSRIPLTSFATAFDLDFDDALARALSLGFRLDKHADPVEPGVRGLSLTHAVSVVQQDPSLVAEQVNVAAAPVLGTQGAEPSGSCGHDGGVGRKCLQPQGHKGPHYDGGESWPVAPESRPLLTGDQLSRMVTAMEASGNSDWAATARKALSGDDAARRDCTTYIRSL